MRRRTRGQAEQKCVLVVSESASVGRALIDAIEEAGHAAVHAESAREALALALSWQPSVVCVDLRLAGMGTEEVAFRIVAAFGSKRPALVAIARPGATLDHDRARQVGFDLVLESTALSGLSSMLTTPAPAFALAPSPRVPAT